MPIMNQQARLFLEPKQDRPSDKVAAKDTPVEVLASDNTFHKVKLLDGQDEPEGWVFDETVDLTGTVPTGPIPKPRFALQCWREALQSDTSPHYMAAVAELRSKTATGEDNGRVGPFRLSQKEWDDARTNPKFGLTDVGPRDITDWRLQCAVFALMAHTAEKDLTEKLKDPPPGREPTTADLYLAQLIGPEAAAAAIKQPAGKITVAFPDLAVPVEAQTDAVLKQIVDALQPVLNSTKEVVIETGNRLLGSKSGDDAIVPKADAPLDGQSLGIPKGMKEPIANFKAKAPAIMAKLMERFELRDEEAAAILGNLGHESRGLTAFQEENPTIKGSAGGWGWAQWTGMGKGGRRRLFFEFIQKQGIADPKSDEANFGFLVHELETSHKGAIQALKAANGLSAKVREFERIYEAAGIKHFDSREMWTKRALDAFRAR